MDHETHERELTRAEIDIVAGGQHFNPGDPAPPPLGQQIANLPGHLPGIIGAIPTGL